MRPSFGEAADSMSAREVLGPPVDRRSAASAAPSIAFVKVSDKRKTLIPRGVVRVSASPIRGTHEGMEHASTQRDLVRVRSADRDRQGTPAEQGEGYEHAPLFERRQREAPGHLLG